MGSQTETPYEYQTSLQKLWPTHLSETKLITQAYVKIRYGEFPETKAELLQIQEAWQQLKAIKINDTNLQELSVKDNIKRDHLA